MKLTENQSIEQVLGAAVVASWADLMQEAQNGLIHIEYGFAASGTLDYLKFWSSITRGKWILACEYWMSASTFHHTGVHFDNGYRSGGLAHVLESVMQNQTAFSLPANLGRQGLIQILMPTKEEGLTAAAAVNEALNRVGAVLTESSLA